MCKAKMCISKKMYLFKRNFRKFKLNLTLTNIRVQAMRFGTTWWKFADTISYPFST